MSFILTTLDDRVEEGVVDTGGYIVNVLVNVACSSLYLSIF